MACLGEYWYEGRELLELALPAVSSNFLESSMIIVDVIMLGHLGRGHIGAYAIGSGYFNILWYFIEGFLTAQDTLSSNAYGKGDLNAVRYWAYVSLIVGIFLSIATSVFILFSQLIMTRAFFLTPHVRNKAVVHVFILLPAVWFMVFYRVLQKYLQSQNIMMPSVVSGLIGNGLNVLFNYLFIFVFQIGFAGCAMATSLTSICMFFILLYHVKKMKDYFVIQQEFMELVKDTPLERPMDRMNEMVSTISTAVDESLQDMQLEESLHKGRTFVTETARSVGTRFNVPGLVRWSEKQKVDIPRDREGDIEMNPLMDETSNHSDGRKMSNTASDLDSEMDETHHKAVVRAHKNTKRQYREQYRNSQNNEKEIVRASLKDSNDHSKHDGNGKEEEEDRDNELDTLLSPVTCVRPEGSPSSPNNSIPPLISNSSPFVAESLAQAKPRKLMLIRTIRFLALGFPGGFMHGLENWIFIVILVVIARMGMIPLGATQISIAYTELVFTTFTFSISIAMTIKIGHALGERHIDKAKTIAKVGFLLGLAVIIGSSTLIYYLPGLVSYIFTSDEDIQRRVEQLSLLVACFQAAYGLQGLCQGVLKAVGKQAEIAGFAFACLYILGLPLAYFWGFYVRPTFGLKGFWFGMLVGMGSLALLLLVLVVTIDWHRESRRISFWETQGDKTNAAPSFPQFTPLSGPLDVNSIAAQRRSRADSYDNEDEDANDSTPLWTSSLHSSAVYTATEPKIGVPMIGSRASGGFHMMRRSLQEEIDEMEMVDIEMLFEEEHHN